MKKIRIAFVLVLASLSMATLNTKESELASVVIPIPTLPESAKALELVWIEPGAFMMGSQKGDTDERPIHEVKITKGFYLGKHEVTQAQYQAITKNNISFYDGDNKPVENVKWDEAQVFIQSLNQMDLGYRFRLPTEAEWEYACRAGTDTEFSWGDGDVNDYAWTKTSKVMGTSEVGLLQPNAWGLYDMSGNVWEFCSDFYSDSYYSISPPADAQGPPSGLFRVARGGSWDNGPLFSRSSARTAASPVDTGGSLGFRIAADKVNFTTN